MKPFKWQTMLVVGFGLSIVAFSGCGGEVPAETSLSVAFVYPTGGQLLLADSDEDGIASGFQTTVRAAATDSAGRAVVLESAQLDTRPTSNSPWTTIGTAVIDGANVSFPGVTLAAGPLQLHVTVKEQGSLRQAEAVVVGAVQQARPKVTAVTAQGDANHDHKLNLAELPSGAPVLDITTFGMEDGAPVVVEDGNGTVIGQGTTTANAATIPLASLASATEVDVLVRILVTNSDGLTNNLGPSIPGAPTNSEAIFTLRVNRVAPMVTVTSPLPAGLIASGADGDPVAPGFQLHVTGTTAPDVQTAGIELVLTPPGGTPTLIDAAGGTFAGNISGAIDGAAMIAVTAIDSSGNRGPTVTVSITFDLTPPGLSAFACNGVTPASNQLHLVAASNIHLFGAPFPSPEPGYVADATPGGNGDLSCGVTVTGAASGTLKATFNGVTVFGPVTPSTNNETIAIPVSLTQGVSANLVVTAADALGNSSAITTAVNVDVQPPADPVPVATLVASLSRSVQVDLTWSASGDDGFTRAVTGYDVRYRPQALFDESPGGPPLTLLRIRDDASYFEPTRSIQLGGAPLGPAVFAASITNLPPWSDYSIAVRAVDDVGNYSTWSADQHVLMASNSRLIIPNPEGGAGNSRFGWNLAAADFDGDGRADLAVGEPFDTNTTLPTPGASPSKVFVYYGQDFNTALAAPQTLTPPEAGSLRYGRDISTGNAGDASGELRPDLLVSAWRAFSFAGRALLYFGRTSATLDTALSPTTPGVVDFRGETGLPGGGWFGYTARVVPDFGSLTGAPDGISEILVAAPNAAGGRGRVYLFWGRTRAQWLAFPGGSIDATAGTFIVPAASANVIFEGEACGGGGQLACPTFFGTNHGVVNVGDVNGDSVPDIAIPYSNDLANKLYIFSGALVQATSGTATILNPTNALATLTQSAVASGAPAAVGSLDGFGSEALVFPNLVGTNPALVVSLPLVSRAFVYASYNQSSAVPLQTLESFYGRLRRLGVALAAADFNADGHSDLILGENVAVPGASAWVMLGTGNAAQPFDATVGNGLHQSRVTGVRALGLSAVVGDFNGDSRVDFAAGDPGTTGEPGEVRIFY